MEEYEAIYNFLCQLFDGKKDEIKKEKEKDKI